MLRAILIATFASFLLITQAFAGQTIKLGPKESKQLTNNALWRVNANCRIQNGQGANTIRVRVMNHQGSVNGKNLAKGQSTSVTVHQNQNIAVSAEPGTTVNLVNLGNKPVEAVCYA